MPKIRILPLPRKAVAKLPAPPPPIIVADFMQKHNVTVDRQSRYDLDNYIIHVSDIIQTETQRKFCARERVLGYMSNKKPVMRAIPPGMSLIHKMGHSLQEHLTDYFIENSSYGHTVWGDWACHCAHRSMYTKGLIVKHSLKPRPGQYKCSECAGEPIHYKEIDLLLPHRRVGGHPDLLLLWNGKLIVYEIKTIERSSVDFTTLDAPLGAHTAQASFYYWIIDWMFQNNVIPYAPYDQLRYIYMDRSTSKAMGGRVYKEFVRPASRRDRIARFLSKADMVNDAVKNRVLPTRLCDSISDTRAKACKACAECFARKLSRF